MSRRARHLPSGSSPGRSRSSTARCAGPGGSRKPASRRRRATRATGCSVTRARKAGARHVLTAHTLDDQAETVLFRHGAGERADRLARDGAGRPRWAICASFARCSAIPKSRLVATLGAAKIPFADDPSNRDPRFTRPRLRELMPRLAAEGLDARRLAALARRADAGRRGRSSGGRRRAGRPARTTPSKAVGIRLPVMRMCPPKCGYGRSGRAIARVRKRGSGRARQAGGAARRPATAGAGARKTGAARFRRTLAGALVVARSAMV